MVELGPHSYNLKPGGEGGWTLEQRKNGRQKCNNRLKEIYGDGWRTFIGQKGNLSRNIKHPNLSSETSKRGHKEGWFTFEGRVHTQEAKDRIGKANKANTGERSSQFGTMWITDGTLNRKIKKGEEIQGGWRKGRVMSPNL